MKDFDYYKTVPVPFPNKLDFTTVYVYHRGKKLFEGTVAEYNFNAEAKIFPKGNVHERVVDEEGYKAARKRYHEAAGKLEKEFAEDLYEEFDVVANPKKYKVYQMAYEHGHASGHQEVYHWFQELVELIK